MGNAGSADLNQLRRESQVALLEALYWEEGWRSHRLDLDDDLHGESCTPTTLARCDWMLAALEREFESLRSAGALDHEPVEPMRESLVAHYRGLRAKAERLLLKAT